MKMFLLLTIILFGKNVVSAQSNKGCQQKVDFNVYVIAESNGELYPMYETDDYGNQYKTYQYYWFKPNGELIVYIGKNATEAYKASPDIRKWQCQEDYILVEDGWGKMIKYHWESGKKDLLAEHWSDTILKFWGQH